MGTTLRIGDIHPAWERMTEEQQEGSAGWFPEARLLLIVDPHMDKQPSTWLQPIRLAISTHQDLLVLSIRTQNETIDDTIVAASMHFIGHPESTQTFTQTPQEHIPADLQKELDATRPTPQQIREELLPFGKEIHNGKMQFQLQVIDQTGTLKQQQNLQLSQRFTDTYIDTINTLSEQWPITPQQLTNQLQHLHKTHPTTTHIWTQAQAITWTENTP